MALFKRRAPAILLMVMPGQSNASLQDLFSAVTGHEGMTALQGAGLRWLLETKVDTSSPIDTIIEYDIADTPDAFVKFYADPGVGFVSVRIRGSAEVISRARGALASLALTIKAAFPYVIAELAED